MGKDVTRSDELKFCPISWNEYCPMKQCAWWNEEANTCSVLVISNALRVLANAHYWDYCRRAGRVNERGSVV